MGIVYYEGQMIAEEEARVPISDRGFQFGDGAFATIQVKDGVALFVETHLKQLSVQCRAFNLIMPLVERQIIEELILRNGATAGIWRLKVIVTGGDSSDSRLPERQGRVMIFLKPFTPQPFKPLKLGIFSLPYYSCHASFKSLAHLNRFYVMEEAHRLRLDDCVTTTEKGFILEAAFGNLFWVKEKTLLTPDPTLPIYFGVTIKNMIGLAKDLGFQVEYVKRPLAELPKEASAFRTNTMQGVRPIAQIGEVEFLQNPTLQALFINGYEQLVLRQKKSEAQGASL